MLVDLVEVVLQDLHLVLGGAARGLRRHGPGAPAGKEGAAAVSEASADAPRGGTEVRGAAGPAPPRSGLGPPAGARARGSPGSWPSAPQAPPQSRASSGLRACPGVLTTTFPPGPGLREGDDAGGEALRNERRKRSF